MKKIILFLLVIVSLALFVNGLSCPTNPPVTYEGSVTVDGIPVDGETVIATVQGSASPGTATEGIYQIKVSPCMGVSSGEITFSINGEEANEVSEYNGISDWGQTIPLGLTFGEIPEEDPCPDGNIDAGEECDTDDLNDETCTSWLGQNWQGNLACTGTCTFETSGCTYECIEDWSCSDWSTCSGGTQSRTCTDSNTCGTTETKPAETQSCEDPSPTGSSSGGGGGGGGGGSSVECRKDSDCKDDKVCKNNKCVADTTIQTESCESDWKCTYGDCISGKKKKTCVDSNSCKADLVTDQSCQESSDGNVPTKAESKVIVEKNDEGGALTGGAVTGLLDTINFGPMHFVLAIGIIVVLGALGYTIYSARAKKNSFKKI